MRFPIVKENLSENWAVHVGYQKTGSTWLQLMLFPHVPDAEFLGKRHPSSAPWVLKLRDLLLNQPSLKFSADHLRQLLAENLAGVAPAKLRIFSDEALVGNWRQGSPDAKRNADRIRAVFGQAKILMVIRSQPKILESIYKTFLNWGGLLTFETFLKGESFAQVPFNLDHVEYASVAEYYVSLFGAPNVRIIPQELLAADSQRFADEICEFLAIQRLPLNQNRRKPANTSFTARYCRYKRLVNFVTRSKFNPDAFFPNYKDVRHPLGRLLHPEASAKALASLEEKLGGGRTLMTEKLEPAICDYYRESNQRLQRLVSHDLAHYGYPL